MTNFIISLFYPLFTCILIILSKKIGFVDFPSKKKIHKIATPNTLGLSIFIYLFVITILNEFSFEIEQVLALGVLVVITGFFDDRFDISPGVKIFFISLPVLYLLFNGFIINDLGKYEYIGTVYLNKFSFVFLYLGAMLLINSFNYIDGIDGLNLSIAITAISFFIFLSDSTNGYILILKYIIYVLFIGLIFNLLPSKTTLKCFIGNTGSLFVGFLIGFIMIFLYKEKSIHPSILIWSCWLPVYDFLFVNIKRLIKNKNIAKSDYEHLHYKIFFKYKKNSLTTLFILNLLNIAVIVCGYLIFTYIGKIYSLFTFILLFFIFYYFVNNLKIVK